MSVALEHAPVIALEPKIPGGGGPGGNGPDDYGGGGGGGDRDDEKRRIALYRLAVSLTLISITSLFTALVFIYYTRSRVPIWWQPVQLPRALWLSTAVLLMSSAYIELARRALAERHWLAYRRRLLIATFLGMAFLASQLLALRELVEQGIYVRGNPHASVFWVFTSAHAAHLLFGMLALLYILLRRGRTWNQHRMMTSLAGLYWHFMGAIWVLLFVMLLAI